MLSDLLDRIALLLCLLFVVVGSLWIGEIGIQNDEALFAGGIYPPFGNAGLHVFDQPVPLMLMTYVGALKSYIWLPIFKIWPPSPASVRFPAVLLGAITIFVFYRLLKRTLNVRAALAATALLACDTSYTLSARWDWGPIVMHHLCLLGGMLCLVRFAGTRSQRWLIAGFALFGLGLWNKALFIWSLTGVGVAVIATFPRQVFGHLTRRTLTAAILAFLAGAAPLIYYNTKTKGATFRQESKMTLQENWRGKAIVLLATFEGWAVLGSIAREPSEPVRIPDDPAKKAFVALSDAIGAPRQNLHLALAGLCLVCLPFVWKSGGARAALFSVIAMAVIWPQMAFLQNAGGGMHHSILLWPMPQLAMGGILAAASYRLGRFGAPALLLVVSIACLSSLAITSTHYANMLRYGGVVGWTDAIYPASEALPGMRPSQVCVLDWGFFEPLRLFHQGRIVMCIAVDPEAEPQTAQLQISDPQAVYITHTEPNELFKGTTHRFLSYAEKLGYRKTNSRIFHDYNGRPIIEVFKLFRP